MARRNQFKVDAESVQGNAGAWALFKALKIKEWRSWSKDPDSTDADLLEKYLIDWGGFEDDDGNALPSPKDEQGVTGELYFHEQKALIALLIQGPVDRKN
jgi:hypothetical protein